LVALEAAAAKALETSLTKALSQLGKRLWSNRLSPAARREKAATDVIRQLTAHDFTGQLRLTRVLPELSTGISLAQIKASLGGPVFEGLLHELVAARVMGMPPHTITRVRENMQIALRLEFPDADADQVTVLGRNLFDELDRVVKGLMANLDGTHGKGLAELREGAAVTLMSATADSIKRHNTHLKLPKTLAEAGEALEWEATYRNQARAAHGYIAPPDFERKRKVPIKSLFVSPTVTAQVNPESHRVRDVWGLRDVIDRTVLLGDPGGGKSTASNLLAWQLASDADGLVPFVVVVRNSASQQRSITDQIESWLRSYYQCAPPRDVVEGLFLSGRAVVIFDGLDELIDTSKRREMTERIELFCTRYPLTKVLVTSRRVGYEEAALDKAVFEVFELADFSDEKVEAYVTSWFTQVDGVDEETAHQLAESFVEESAAVEDLRRNPLMLALMCIIYRGQNWIPRNRPDMYEHCAKLLFEKWDASRQIYVELKAKAYVDSAIKQLAYWMFMNSEAAQGVREGELVKEATTYLEPAFGSRPEAEQAAQEFIDFCRGRGWVLTDVGTTAEGEALFAFTHRTFMEYFAAYELTRRQDGPEKIARAILPHAASAEWEIVTELAVQISNKHSSGGAERILTVLLNDRRHRSSASQLNISRFAIHCLNFAHTTLPLAARIGRSYIESTIRNASSSKKIQPIYLSIVTELRERVEDEIFATLKEVINGPDIDAKNIAIEFLLDLPRIVTDFGRNATRTVDTDQGRWRKRQLTLAVELKDHILAKRDTITWFSAWRINLISLEHLLMNGPTASDPLSILFTECGFTYTKVRWANWAPLLARTFLQSDKEETFTPATLTEIEWLGQFMDRQSPPPLVTTASYPTFLHKNNGDFLTTEIYTNHGWTLFRLLLISVEAGMANSIDTADETEFRGTYAIAVSALKRRRASAEAMPLWFSDAIGALQSDRRDLVVKWLNNEVNFIGPR
jgi:hypothetical protein